MIQHHAEDLLRPALRASSLHAAIDRVDGLVAPAFLMTAGFSLALTQVRARGGWDRSRRSLLRIGEVLLAATFVNWLWFPIFREPRWIGRIDILQCIGLSLLLLLPLSTLLATRPRTLAAAAVAIALAAFAAAPFAEHVSGPLAQLCNVESGAMFPLLPWLGYVALGTALGAAAARGRRALLATLAGLAGLGLLVWLLRPAFIADLPPHAFWITDPSGHGDRWALVCAIGLALLGVEALRPLRAGPRVIAFFSTHSLSAYVFHEALLYYSVLGFSFTAWFGGRCGWGRYWLLTVTLIAATWALCLIWDPLERGARTIVRAAFLRRARSTAPPEVARPR